MIESVHIKNVRPPWDQQYYSLLSSSMAQSAREICELENQKTEKFRVLDAGCGSGETMQALKENGFNPSGIDINRECVEISRKYGRTYVSELMTLDQIFPENSFDLVICSHVLEHMENPKAAIEILKKITSKKLLIAVPNLARLANFMIRIPRLVNHGHISGWDCHHLKTFLEKHCNLKIISWIQDGVILPPLRNKYLYTSFFLHFIEYKLLPKIMPQQANSLIVMCEI